MRQLTVWMTLVTIFCCNLCNSSPIKRQIFKREAIIIDQYFDNSPPPDADYMFRYELSDGTIRYEVGYTRIINGVEVVVIEGFYKYIAPDGQIIKTEYFSDENGYHLIERTRSLDYLI